MVSHEDVLDFLSSSLVRVSVKYMVKDYSLKVLCPLPGCVPRKKLKD